MQFLAEDGSFPFGVRADIVCMAKALGSGLPMGAMLADHSIMDWPPGTHANTFGGNLLASSASMAGIEFMEKEKIGAHAKKMGEHIMGDSRKGYCCCPAETRLTVSHLPLVITKEEADLALDRFEEALNRIEQR
ncbi:aminotransferase class III-fold pyridoxal phosphate-dependent enzyme [Methanolobus sp. ZRKC3]|uniref:aminotransferase class III-fold pyridoxal phosphate-dependent enzyme n=1 Tax=Methanolobus sp. ZRKC3 TaxID=3125786 RepID=UPI003244AF74